MSSTGITESVYVTNFLKHMHKKTIFYKILCSVHDIFLKVSYMKSIFDIIARRISESYMHKCVNTSVIFNQPRD